MGACLAFASSSRGGETFKDDARGFSLTLPDGFAANPALASASPSILRAFTLNEPSGSKPGIMLIIEKMDGTIDQEHLTPESMPAGFKGRLFTTNWQGYVVDAIAVPEHVGDVATTTYNVQIPLRRAAIQVKLFGPADRKAELDRLLTEILGGLHGESNWSAAVAPNGAMPAPKNYGMLLLVVAIVFIIAGLVGLYYLSRRSPKGTVLAIAAGIYIASWSLEGSRFREVIMLAGAMRLLGFMGGLLGIIDLLRERKHRPAAAGPDDYPYDFS